MAHKITPSRRKFRAAKALLIPLQEAFGKRLNAVFVYGSVAMNMAKPDSDIDVAVILGNPSDKDFEITEGLLNRRINSEMQLVIIPKQTFEMGLFTYLQRGAIPIFGEKEYLKKFSAVFKYPSLEGIKRTYLNGEKVISDPLTRKPLIISKAGKRVSDKENEARTALKKNRQRFFPR